MNLPLPFPVYTKAERRIDATVHAIGIAFAVIAMPVLIIWAWPHLGTLPLGAVAVYGLCAIAMFICSAGYNLINRPDIKEIMRRLDHAAIFTMIAGTYTPFAAIAMDGIWGVGLLLGVWSIAAFGIALKLFAPKRFSQVSVGLYLVQGWLVLVAIGPLTQAVSTSTLVLLGIGGALYCTGVVFHLWERLPFQNAIWHTFVLAAAVCHYAAVIDVAAAAG